MILASRTIQSGRIARRIGEPLDANPHMPPECPFKIMEHNGNKILFRDEMDYHDLWEIGWNIEDRWGKVRANLITESQ